MMYGVLALTNTAPRYCTDTIVVVSGTYSRTCEWTMEAFLPLAPYALIIVLYDDNTKMYRFRFVRITIASRSSSLPQADGQP